MSTMKQMLTAALACSMISSTAVYAQEQSSKPAPGAMFQKLDLDGDGRLSKDEAQKSERKRLYENFETIDTNKDGFLDKAELKAMREKMRQSRKAG